MLIVEPEHMAKTFSKAFKASPWMRHIMGSLTMLCQNASYDNGMRNLQEFMVSLSVDNSPTQEEWKTGNNSIVYHNDITQATRTMSVTSMYIECVFLRFNN